MLWGRGSGSTRRSWPETDDQAFILSGKSADSEGARDGFVVRFTDFREEEGILWLLPEEDYSYDWVYRFGSKGRDDGVNAVAQIKDSLFARYRADKRCDPLLFGQIEAPDAPRFECHVHSSKEGSRALLNLSKHK